MKEKLMYQCVLRSDNAIMVTWLSNEKEFKVGDWITLKTSEEPDRKWEVLNKDFYPHHISTIKQKWSCQDIKRDSKRKKII